MSIIYKLPVRELDYALDRLGLEKTWHSILATHLTQSHRTNLLYILDDVAFHDIEILNVDFLQGLSIGEISALYEYSLAYIDCDKRKQEGQFFTPDDVAEVMAKKAHAFPKNKTWIDPCSGVGNLSYWLVQKQDDPESFLKRNMYLVDRDTLALLIARVILVKHFQRNDKNLFVSIAPRFIVADFLSDKRLPKYDYAILNPPYAVVEPDARFESSTARDLYAYFLERVMKTTRGFVSISPQTFTNGQKFHSFRRLLLTHFNAIDIFCFDNVPDSIFRGVKFGSKNSNKVNSTRAGVIVARQGSANSVFRITPLLRWRTHERNKLLASIDHYLVRIQPRDDIFPKVQKDLLPFYKLVKRQQKTLAHLLSSRPTPYKLVVPSTPRYFISALKRPVMRSSFKTLYFYNDRDRDTAYLLLNSSYMYWWWRVNDGGMTISERTLHTLPVFDNMTVDERLLRKLERSETTNIVVKKNAGRNNENVKHDPSLVKKINMALTPRFASTLERVHNNSVIPL